MTVYLDNNATTKTCDEAIEKMMPFFGEKYGNPSSMHAFGGEVGRHLKKAREQVAGLVGAADANEIVFTGCGTESSNLALRGLTDPRKKHIITTKVEHPCVLNVAKHLEKNHGYEVTYLGVNAEGEIDFDEFKDSIRDDTALVSVMWANNETGVIFPVEKLAETAKEKNPGVLFFVDAVQAAGKIPLDVARIAAIASDIVNTVIFESLRTSKTYPQFANENPPALWECRTPIWPNSQNCCTKAATLRFILASEDVPKGVLEPNVRISYTAKLSKFIFSSFCFVPFAPR